MLSKKHIPQIKQQLINHVNANFPEDKKFIAINQIQNMNDEQLEQFLIQNKLLRTSPPPEQKFQQQVPEQPAPVVNTPAPKKKVKKAAKKPVISKNCVFCHIAHKTIKSYWVDENKSAIAVLEIHPVTQGHVIIIPKEHIATPGEMPSQAWTLAKKLAKKLKNKFKKAKDIKVVSSNVMGHEIINTFPVYKKGETLKSERLELTEKQMKRIQKRLMKKSSKKKKKPIPSKTQAQKLSPTPSSSQQKQRPSQTAQPQTQPQTQQVVDESLPPKRVKVQAKPKEIFEPTWIPKRKP